MIRTVATLAKWFRTQRVPSDPKWTVSCTTYSYLTAMAVHTAGAVGPAITGAMFRKQQRDDEGGIDLYDGKVAARHWGINFTVFANYGVPSEYPGLARDEPAIAIDSLRSMVRAGRIAVVQGDSAKVPDTLDCGHLTVLHAVCVAQFNPDVGWLVANPVCMVWKWWPDSVFRAFTASIAGRDHVDCALSPLPLTKRVSVKPARLSLIRLFRRYILAADGSWTHVTRGTRGFDAKVGSFKTIEYRGNIHHLVRVADASSGFNGWWVDNDAAGVTVYSA